MSGPDDDDDAFREAMAGVAPIEKRGRVRVTRPRAARPVLREPPAFTVEDGVGFAHGVSRRQRNELRAGKLRIDASVDLHRQSGDVARDTVVARITEAAAAGARCVLIVHGRGAVLRDVAVEALTTSLARVVLAYCTARPRDGGEGALYVLLKRTERGPASRPPA